MANERTQVEALKGQISVYQNFVVNVMKLNLPDEMIDKLAYFHEHASVPHGSIKEVGIREADREILQLIKNNRDRYRGRPSEL